MNFLTAMFRSQRPRVMTDAPATGASMHGTVQSGSVLESNRREGNRSGISRQPGPPPLRSGQALQPQQIELDVDVPDVKRALERAAAVICRAHGLDPAPVFRALWRREQIGSTAIGHGVALPHARISGIAKPLMLFMRPKYAIEFGAPDSRLVTKVWVILVPADGPAQDHLDLLAAIARACSDVHLREELDSAATADDAARVFSDWTQRQYSC